MIINTYCSPSVLWYKVRYDLYVSKHNREQESISGLIFHDMMDHFGKMLSRIWMIGIRYSSLNWPTLK